MIHRDEGGPAREWGVLTYRERAGSFWEERGAESGLLRLPYHVFTEEAVKFPELVPDW